jgi:hypothetical protein
MDPREDTETKDEIRDIYKQVIEGESKVNAMGLSPPEALFHRTKFYDKIYQKFNFKIPQLMKSVSDNGLD